MNAQEATFSGVKKCAQQFNRVIGDDLLDTWASVFEKCDPSDVSSAFTAAVSGDHFPSIPEIKGLVKMARERREEKENGAAKAEDMARRQAEFDAERERRAAAPAPSAKTKLDDTFAGRLAKIWEETRSELAVGKPEHEVFALATRYAEMMQEHDMDFDLPPGNFVERRNSRLAFYADAVARTNNNKGASEKQQTMDATQ